MNCGCLLLVTAVCSVVLSRVLRHVWAQEGKASRLALSPRHSLFLPCERFQFSLLGRHQNKGNMRLERSHDQGQWKHKACGGRPAMLEIMQSGGILIPMYRPSGFGSLVVLRRANRRHRKLAGPDAAALEVSAANVPGSKHWQHADSSGGYFHFLPTQYRHFCPICDRLHEPFAIVFKQDHSPRAF